MIRLVGNSQQGFTKSKSCPKNLVAFHDGAAALVYLAEQLTLATWTSAKELTLSHITSLSPNWIDLDSNPSVSYNKFICNKLF